MTSVRQNPVIFVGFGLIILATMSAAAGDGVTKALASRVPSGVVLFWVGLLVAIFAVLISRFSNRGLLAGSLRTRYPWQMALRAVLSVVSVWCFFQAFGRLQLAEVFVFIGLMPLMAAALSALVLNETVSRSGWAALILGALGVGLLFPGGVHSIEWGHIMAFGGAGAGTASLVLMRRIALREKNALAQVLYPHLALSALMFPSLAGSGVWVTAADFWLVVILSALVFVTRSLMVPAFARLRAHVATMLLNLQFIWMVAIGAVGFAEIPDTGVFLGAGMVICAGLLLIFQQRYDARQRELLSCADVVSAKQRAKG